MVESTPVNTVRTRIAPSPTGFPHIGTIYQALINYAFAKHANGQFIVRIEDTDRTRFVEGAEEAIFDALDWFGLIPDESPKHGGPYPPYRQSEKLDEYKKHAEELVKNGYAYYCFCTRERLEKMRADQIAAHKPTMYDRHCLNLSKEEIQKKLEQDHVIRMKINRTSDPIVLSDRVRGSIRFDPNLIDDQVILKSDGFPTYHLAVVIDDHDMKISHVIRGEEWISSAPKHILLYQYLFADTTPPEITHTPLLRNPDNSKLSKRHGHASVSWYREQGFLPEAILNYLAHLVWSHPEGKEKYSLDEFVEKFNLDTMSPYGAKFDLAKLEWLNGVYIRELSDDTLFEKLDSYIEKRVPRELIKQLAPLAQERMKKFSEFTLYLKPFIDFQPAHIEVKYKELLPVFQGVFESITNWNTSEIETKSKALVEEKQLTMRDAFMAVRLAVTGEKIGLPLFETLEILGKEEVIQRIQSIIHSSSS